MKIWVWEVVENQTLHCMYIHMNTGKMIYKPF